MTFAHPLILQAFWGLPLIPLLYLIRRRARRRELPHLHIWERVFAAEGRVRRRRIEDVLGILLQAAVASALILAAAGPSRRDEATEPGRIAVVIDLSQGSAAIGGDGMTRKSVVLDAVRADLDALLAHGPVAVWRLGGGLFPVLPFSTDRREIDEALDGLPDPAGRSEPEKVAELAKELQSQVPKASLRFYSTGAFPLAPDGGCLLADGIVTVPIPAAGRNAAIVGLEPLPAAAEPDRVRVQVEVAAFAGPFHGRLVLALEGEELAEATLEVAAGETRRVTLEGRAAPEQSLDLRLVDAEGSDALATDDAARFVQGRSPALRVLVAAAPIDRHLRAALAALDERIDAAAAAVVAPEHWREAHGYDLTILVGRDEREPLPPGAYILVDSYFPGLGLDAGQVVDDVEIDPHPRGQGLLRGLDLRDFSLRKARSLRARPPAEVVLAASSGALISRGRNVEGAAFVHLAFAADEANTSLVLLPAWPLLLADAIDWLLPRRERPVPGALGAGQDFAWRGPMDLEEAWAEPIPGLPAERFPLVATFPGRIHRAPELPGSYRIGRGESSERSEVNRLDAEVSDTRSRFPGSWTPPAVPEPRRRLQERSLAGRFLAAALGLLLLEWLAFHRRWTT